MFGVVDETLKPKRPQVFLCKPDLNRTSIGKLNQFIYGLEHTINLHALNEISFRMPYEVTKEIEHKLIPNPHIENVLERFLIKVKLDENIEYFIINKIEDNMDETTDIKTVHAFSLGYELRDRLVRQYEVVSYTIDQIANDILAQTLWSVGDIDSTLVGRYRSFNVSEKSVLETLFDVAETFDAYVEFDTVNRLIHFKDQQRPANRANFTVSYGKYLKSLGRTSEPDEIVTRFHAYGENGMSINRVSPTGATYLEDLSYFMYPFERDENKNVIRSSYYMSDELCHAILDYNELIESKATEFSDLLALLSQYQSQYLLLDSEMFTLTTELKMIQDRLDVQRANSTFLYYENVYSGQSETVGLPLNYNRHYMIMAWVSDRTKINIDVDDVLMPLPESEQWFILKKITEQELTYVDIAGTSNAIAKVYIVAITEDEYNATDNDFDLIEKYNEQNKLTQIANKQIEIDAVNIQIADVQNLIDQLKDEISVENNFTPELIQERNQYIIERTWTDENYIDDVELYEAAKVKFEELKTPKTVLELDIINFFDVIEESRNWNLLKIGDEIKIKYEKIGVNASAKVSQMHFDYDNQTIKLTIANIKDLMNRGSSAMEMLKQSFNTSTEVNMGKYKWYDAEKKSNYVHELLEGTWDANARKILAGGDESVEIGDRGIVVRNPEDPNKMIVIRSGIVAMTSDGQNWKTALTSEYISADLLLGRILAGQNLIIENESGTVRFDGDGLVVNATSFKVMSEDDKNLLDEWMTRSEWEQSASEITARFFQINNTNKLKNSVGLNGTELWEVVGTVETVQNNELIIKGAGSGFQPRNGTLRQTVLVDNEKTYTLSSIIKKPNSGLVYMKVVGVQGTEDNTVLVDFELSEVIDFVKHSITFQPLGNEITVEFYASATANAIFTSNMLNEGEDALPWQNSNGEVHNTNVKMDINGIKVLQIEEDGEVVGYTIMTPQMFAGYYKDEQVFKMDKDEFVMKKAVAQNEITMGNIKVLNIDTPTRKGWAFVPV